MISNRDRYYTDSLALLYQTLLFIFRSEDSFQGDETAKNSDGGGCGLSREAEGRRRRGGSMDNLIDSVGGEEITTNTRWVQYKIITVY